MTTPPPRPRSTTQTRAERLIIVYGATGTLGGLVARALRDRGAAVVVAGRDRDRVASLGQELGCRSTRIAAPDDPAALAALVAGARVVVDCAGPFAGRTTALVRAAIEAGAAYLDTASEPAFLREVYERCEAAARKAGVACVSGAGVAPALGDLAAAWAAAHVLGAADDDGVVRATLPARQAEGDPLDEVAITWVLDGMAAAPGAQRAGIAMLTHGGAIWKDGSLGRDRGRHQPPHRRRRARARRRAARDLGARRRGRHRAAPRRRARDRDLRVGGPLGVGDARGRGSRPAPCPRSAARSAHGCSAGRRRPRRPRRLRAQRGSR